LPVSIMPWYPGLHCGLPLMFFLVQFVYGFENCRLRGLLPLCGRGVMKIVFSGKTFRLAFGALAVLLIAVLFPGFSWAGCSHLAHSTRDLQRVATLTSLDELITGRDLGTGVPVNPSPRQPTPCSGASCSGQIPLPVSTTISTFAPIELWGLLLGTLKPVQRTFQSGWSVQSLPSFSVLPSAVFHPPRASF
jgi:hypothetical protein